MSVINEPSSASAECPPNPMLIDLSTLDPATRAIRREKLRSIHFQCGVHAAYLILPPGHSLWFVAVGLDIEVHAGCLGFTRNLYEFALGTSMDDAIDAVKRHFAVVLPHANVVRATARLSSCNHPEELTFPEQVRRKDLPNGPQAKQRPKGLRT